MHLLQKFFYILSLTAICASLAYGTIPDSIPIQKKTMAIYTPHIFNPKFFAFEFGFVTQKKIKSLNYPFNAFAKILIAEEFFTTATHLRAGAIGIKTGVFLPTQPWFPLLLELSIGYGKTSLHESPWLGDRDNSVQDSELFLAEAGAIYRISSSVFVRVVYQVNSLDYFKRQTFFSVGFTF